MKPGLEPICILPLRTVVCKNQFEKLYIKPVCLDCEEYYPEGRMDGGGGLDNMRSMEQYLPNPNQSRPYSDQKGMSFKQ